VTETSEQTGAAERHFVWLFLLVALGFGGRMAMVSFNGPLAERFTDNGYLIGALLAVGPLVAALVNPAVGRLSDRTWTRFGRRIPYALVGVPLATLVFFAIPSSPDYTVLLLLFFLRSLTISIAGVPLMSLIPDMVPAHRRGRTMAGFMIAGGLGAVAVQSAGKLFWESNFAYVFYLAGALTVVFAIPPLFFIREPRPRDEELAAARARSGLAMRAMLATLVRGDAISLYLISSTFRFLGIGIAVTYFTLFAFSDLGISVGDAALAMALAGGLLRMVLALPAGLVADRWNRKRLLMGASIGAAAVHLATAVAVSDLAGLYAVLAAGALVGTLEMTVSGPLFMDLMPSDRRGELTGVSMVLGNVFQAAGALLGGAVFQWSGGYRASYAVAALCLALSAVALARVVVKPPGDQSTVGERPSTVL
jgi:MFS family permease